MRRSVNHGARAGVLALAGGALVCAALTPLGAAAASSRSTGGSGGFRQVNLVSDKPGLARITDPDVRNPWGIALGPTTPLWVANNGTATATIYAGANGTDPVSKAPLTVALPPAPTGQVYNPTNAFPVSRAGQRGAARFLFDTISNRLVAWSPEVEPLTSSQTEAFVANHVYVGLALAQTRHGPRLYAADGAGRIDVFDGHYRLLPRPGRFVDPMLPRGLSPYNVAVLRQQVFVAYAPAPGATSSVDGAIDVYTLGGRLLRRLVTGGPLDDPWGMVIAPAHWGHFGRMLLVGNEEEGKINAFSARTGAFRGTLRDSTGAPLVNDGLWGLAFGNGVFGTPRTLIFAAGIDEYAHGLVGIIKPN